MNSNPEDSGFNNDFSPIKGDTTNPSRADGLEPISLSNLFIQKLDSNVENIKENVTDIKAKIDFDHHHLIVDICIGAISSLIVSIIILFMTTNIGQQTISIFGLQLHIFILIILIVLITAISTFFISKKITIHQYNKRKKN